MGWPFDTLRRNGTLRLLVFLLLEQYVICGDYLDHEHSSLVIASPVPIIQFKNKHGTPDASDARSDSSDHISQFANDLSHV